MRIISFFLLSSTLIFANDQSEYFINSNGKRLSEQTQNSNTKKMFFLNHILQEKLVEFSACSRQIDKVPELKSLIEEPGFFYVARKLLRDADYAMEMQNLLVAIAQDPTMLNTLKQKARNELNDNYTPFLALKSHEQAGLEAQEAIDSFNRFKIWEEKKFPLLYQKQYEPEILNACFFMMKSPNIPLFYRVKSAKMLSIAQNQEKEVIIETLLSLFKEISFSQIENSFGTLCFIEIARLLTRSEKNKEEILKNLYSIDLIKSMDQFGDSWQHLSTYQESFLCLPFIIATIISILPAGSEESDIWVHRVENLFHFYINHVKKDQKEKFSEQFVLIFNRILGEQHFAAQKITSFALEYIDMNDSNGFLSIYKGLLEKKKENVSHNQQNTSFLDIDGITKSISINFNTLTELNAPLFPPFQNFDRKNLYPCIQKLLTEYNDLPKIEKDALNKELETYEIEDLINFGSPFLFSYIDSFKDHFYYEKLSYFLNQISSFQSIPSLTKKGLTEGSYLLLRTFLNMKKISSYKIFGIRLLYPLLFNNAFSETPHTSSSVDALKVSIFNFIQRDKEIALCQMTKKLTASENSDHLFNNIKYIESLLGVHIGLHPASYQHTVQSLIENMNCEFSSNILTLSTQELLDLFYKEFFHTKKIISHISELINNKQIRIISKEQDVTLPTAWATLDKKEHNRLICYTVDQNGSLENIKNLGTLKLLQHFDFLTRTGD